MKIRLLTVICFVSVIFSSCTTIPQYTFLFEDKWLEGKSYPVEIGFRDNSEIGDVIVFYNTGIGIEQSIRLDYKNGSYRGVIPGVNIQRGIFSFKFGVTVKGELKFTQERFMKVLSLNDYVAELKSGLKRRISINAPTFVTYFNEFNITVKVSGATEETGVKLFFKYNGDSEYRELPLERSQTSFSTTIIPSGNDEKDDFKYYIEVSEPHEDFDSISVQLPFGASDLFDTIHILDREGIQAQIKSELARSIRIDTPENGSALYDFPVSVILRINVSSLLSELMESSPDLYFRYSSDNNQGEFRELLMTKNSGFYSVKIPSSGLSGSQLFYRIKARVSLDVLGDVDVELPVGDSPNMARVMDAGETRDLLVYEIREAAFHEAPDSVREIDEVEINLGLNFKSDAWFTRNLGMDRVSVYLVCSRRGSYQSEVVIKSTYENNTFSAVIPPGLLGSGINSYFFVAQISTGTVLGDIEVRIPDTHLIPLNILTLEELRESAVKNLTERMSIQPVSRISGLEDVELKAEVTDISSIKSAYLFLKRPGDINWVIRPMIRQNNAFLSTVTAEEIYSGFIQYYFTFSEQEPDLGLIEVTMPENGKLAPYLLELEDREILYKRYQNDLLSSISFFNPMSINYWNPGKLKLSLDNSGGNKRVSFLFRRTIGGSFIAVPAIGLGDTFYAEVPEAMLNYRSFGFYIKVSESVPNLGVVTVDLPNGSGLYRVDVVK